MSNGRLPSGVRTTDVQRSRLGINGYFDGSDAPTCDVIPGHVWACLPEIVNGRIQRVILYLKLITRTPPWPIGSVLDQISLPPVFESRRGHI